MSGAPRVLKLANVNDPFAAWLITAASGRPVAPETRFASRSSLPRKSLSSPCQAAIRFPSRLCSYRSAVAGNHFHLRAFPPADGVPSGPGRRRWTRLQDSTLGTAPSTVGLRPSPQPPAVVRHRAPCPATSRTQLLAWRYLESCPDPLPSRQPAARPWK